VIAHDRRRILGCSVTKHPTSAWVIQQLREAFPYDAAPGYLIFDRAIAFNQTHNVFNFGLLKTLCPARSLEEDTRSNQEQCHKQGYR
jgi:putative transposase